MNIALMTNNFKPFLGGVSISVERLAKGLRKMGHEVTVFAPTYEEQVEEENVFRYATLMKRFVGGIVLPNPFDRRIKSVFQQKKYDVIHVHHPMLIGRTAVYLSKKYKVPLVFTYHTRYEQYLSYVKGIRVLEKLAKDDKRRLHNISKKILHVIQDKMVPAYLHTFLKHCDFVFAPTKGMQEYLVNICKVPVERTAILPTGIEKHHFQVMNESKITLRQKYQTENVPMLLSVSRMSHEKNVDFLLRSIQNLKEQYQKPFKVLLVGDGPNRKDYQDRCKELMIEEEVIFTGAIPNEEIASYFATADVFLFASKTETQGIVIVEALAGATPVVAVDATGVSDIVVNGENGFLLPEKIEAFTECIMKVLNSDSDYRRLSKNAVLFALDYLEEAVAGRAVRFYNNVVAQRIVKDNEVAYPCVATVK